MKYTEIAIKDLTKERLYKFLVIHNMSIAALAKRYRVNGAFILNHIKKYSFDLNMEREKYQRMKNSQVRKYPSVISSSYPSINGKRIRKGKSILY